MTYGPLLAQRHEPICSMLPELGFHCTSFTKSVLCGLRTGYLTVPRRMAIRADSILRVNSWMATPLLAEVATRWIADGTAQRLVEVQRERLAVRHRAVMELLGEHVIGHHPNALTAWVGIPRTGSSTPSSSSSGIATWRSPHPTLPGQGHPAAGCHPAMHRQRAERGAGAHRDRHHRQRLPSIPGRQQLQLGRPRAAPRLRPPIALASRQCEKGGRSAAGRSAPDTFLSCVTAMH